MPDVHVVVVVGIACTIRRGPRRPTCRPTNTNFAPARTNRSTRSCASARSTWRDVRRPALARVERAGSRRPRRGRSGGTRARARRTAGRSCRRAGATRSPMPTRGAPGLAARNSREHPQQHAHQPVGPVAAPRPVRRGVADRVPGEEVLALGGQLHAVAPGGPRSAGRPRPSAATGSARRAWSPGTRRPSPPARAARAASRGRAAASRRSTATAARRTSRRDGRMAQATRRSATFVQLLHRVQVDLREGRERLDRVLEDVERHARADRERRLAEPLARLGADRVGAGEALAVGDQREEARRPRSRGSRSTCAARCPSTRSRCTGPSASPTDAACGSVNTTRGTAS